MDVCYRLIAVFFIARLVLLTFQFTTWNNVSLYTKILEGLEQKLGGGLSPTLLVPPLFIYIFQFS